MEGEIIQLYQTLPYSCQPNLHRLKMCTNRTLAQPSELSRVGPERATPSQTELSQAWPGRAGLNKAEPSRAMPSPSKTGPNRAELGGAGPRRAASIPAGRGPPLEKMIYFPPSGFIAKTRFQQAGTSGIPPHMSLGHMFVLPRLCNVLQLFCFVM